MKSIRKYANRIPFICAQKKFCYGQHKLILSSKCDCIDMCKMEKPIYFVSDFKCAFTDKKRISRDCNCTETCCANQSELDLYFSKS